MVVSHLMWILGTELRPSSRQFKQLNLTLRRVTSCQVGGKVSVSAVALLLFLKSTIILKGKE